MRPIATCLIFFLIFACTVQKENQQAIQTLDIEAGFKNQKELFLSDIADSIAYVKLETTPECLIGNGWALIRDERIFFKTNKPDRILIFDTNGKYLSKIEKVGKGPGEYSGIFQWTVSPSGKMLAFSDLATQTIYLYTSDGDFISKEKGAFMWYSGFFFRNDEELLVCTKEILNYNPDFPIILEYSDGLSVQDTILAKEWKGISTLPPGLPGIGITFYGNQENFYYKEKASDTLFHLDNNNELHPRIVFKLGDKSMDINVAHSPDRDAYYHLHSFFEIKGYLSFVVSYKDEMNLLYYNKNSKELFSLPDNYFAYGEKRKITELKNDLDGFDYPFSKFDNNDDIWTSLHQMVDLKTLESEGFFGKPEIINSPKGRELGELVKNSQLNDNPIVRILYLDK